VRSHAKGWIYWFFDEERNTIEKNGGFAFIQDSFTEELMLLRVSRPQSLVLWLNGELSWSFIVRKCWKMDLEKAQCLLWKVLSISCSSRLGYGKPQTMKRFFFI